LAAPLIAAVFLLGLALPVSQPAAGADPKSPGKPPAAAAPAVANSPAEVPRKSPAKRPAKSESIPIAELKRDKPVDFQAEVLPLLRSSCLACHNSTKAESHLVLETPRTILQGGESGPAVVPKHGGESLLLKAAAHQDDLCMPPADNRVQARSLTSAELGLLKLWIDQGATGEVVAKAVAPSWQPLSPTLQPILSVAISAAGETVACGRGNEIFIYQPAKGDLIARLVDPALADPAHPSSAGHPSSQIAHRDLVQSLAFQPKGDLLASGAFREVKLWRHVGANWTLARTIGAADDPAQFADRVAAVDFSADGRLLATGGGQPSRGGELKIFTAADGKFVRAIANPHSDSVCCVRFSPDGSLLASGGADRFLKVFRVANGELVKSFEGHTGYLLGVAWRADGRELASCSADNSIKIWELATGEQKRTIEGFGKEVTGIGYVAATPRVLTSCGDRVVRLHNTDNGGNERNYFGAGGFLNCLAVSADGHWVAAGGQDGVLRVWNVDTSQELRHFDPPK